MFKIEFSISDSMKDGDGLPDVCEVAEVIGFVQEKVNDGYTSGLVTDKDGNEVGSWNLDNDGDAS